MLMPLISLKSSSAVMVSICEFAVSFSRFLRKKCGSGFGFLRFQILIMCRANTNDTGENTCIAAVQNSDLRHSGRSRCNGELIIISMLQVAT